MQEALKKLKEDEERQKQEEEERIKLEEEAEIARLEAVRLEQERKERKKQKEKERKERLKAEGKLLTAKQKVMTTCILNSPIICFFFIFFPLPSICYLISLNI